MPLQRLFFDEKTIPYAGVWTEPDTDNGYFRFSVPLDIGDVTQTGLTLTVGAYAYIPNKNVTFEIAVQGLNETRRIRLARVDWRSLKGGHSNQRGKCKGVWDGLRVPATHFHSFEMNWVESERRMKKGNLPCARPIDDQPIETFEELLRFVGISFNIKNIELVPTPNWEYELFP